MTETLTLVSQGQRVVISITLPKNPESPARKVTLNPEGEQQHGPSGWTFADKLTNISLGDKVDYKIEKNAEGFHKLTHIAPVTTEKGSGGEEAQMAEQDAPLSQGHGDASGGGDGGPIPAAERAVPNEDTQRFEGWGYGGNVNIVLLTFGELSDAVEGGELDKLEAKLQARTAEVLLNAADQAQKALVGRTDRSALSHKAARDAVRAVVDKRPLRGSIDDIPAWAADIQKTATRLLQLAASL